jgi:hypothetical protein
MNPSIAAALSLALSLSPSTAGPCDVMNAASSALRAAGARMEAACETDTTLTGPCTQAVTAEYKALDTHKTAMARCKASIDASKAAMEGNP